MTSIEGTPAERRPGRPAGGPAVVLISDPNYVVPTFAAALSADRHLRDETPVHLFVVGAADDLIARITEAARGTKIVPRAATLAGFADLARSHRDRYLPPIALARFWLDELLGPAIDRFLYLDGDVMVDGPLDPLLADPPPEGRIMAAPDALAIYIDERLSRGRRADLAYLEGLRCPPESYFNSGVLYTTRAAWAEIVAVARTFLRDHPDRCRSSDQSALNFAANGRVSPLPIRYNYQSEHMMAFDPRGSGRRPTIWHFTSAPKPWDVAGWPWDASFTRDYVDAADRLARQAVPPPEAPPAQVAAGLAHRARARRRLAWVYPWRRITRRRHILRHF